MQTRPVRPEEFEQAGRVVLAAYRALPGGQTRDDYAAQLMAVERRAREAEVFVAVEDERGILGCVTFVPDASSPWAELLEEEEAGVRMLAVLPCAQGRGIGSRLLDTCIDRARAGQKRALMLHTTPWMQSAHRLYERAGFERLPERDWRPLPEVPLLAYRLPL